VRILVAGSLLDTLRVHALLERMQRHLTRFEATSELARLNAAAGAEVAVSPILLRAVEAAVAAARRSGGLVDPTVLADLERAGYAASRAGLLPASVAAEIAAAPARRPARPRPGSAWTRIEVDPRRGTVRLPPGVGLDLGGTAKGLAVDLAADMLAPQPSFAIDAGGDIRVGGRRTVHIAHPLDDGIACSFEITSGAVATSGVRTRVWTTADGYAHHLIDPARGEPAWTGVIQATALAPTALEAETLAKTALLQGPGGREVLARHGGALILDDGELVLAGGLEAATGLAA
jgi:thiamine biosynthesis lipoprotein